MDVWPPFPNVGRVFIQRLVSRQNIPIDPICCACVCVCEQTIYQTLESGGVRYANEIS